MARCNACYAPLPPHCGVCAYCGSQNDVDLKGIHEFTVNEPDSSRICPDCEIPLHSLDLELEGRFYIERCEKCLGLFFDPGELEALMEKSVSNVFAVNRQKIDALVREQVEVRDQIVYRKCPVCRQFMHRANFGYRSGIIVDQCRNHGVWLENGELRRLLGWKKAGGQLLHERVEQRREEEQKRQERMDAYRASGSVESLGTVLSSSPSEVRVDLIDALANVFGRLFK